MSTLTAVAESQVRTEIAELRDAIVHQVASAFEAGGATWEVTAPLVHELLDGTVTDAAPVVVARTLGRALAEQALALERSLTSGDMAAVTAALARLHDTRGRLASVLSQ